MNNNLKIVISFGNFINQGFSFKDVTRQVVIQFLDSKMKPTELDPDKKWITTWNVYLNHLKYFFRWLYNEYIKNNGNNAEFDSISPMDWVTPEFMKIKKKKTKRLSPYIESELWSKEELLLVIKYEQFKRNKAALSLLWDLDARNHEVTLLKIKHVRLGEKYGEGEIPYESKTGSGPMLLTCSFPYVRDWLNEHPFKNEIDARLICNLHNGAPIKPEALWTVMKQLKKRITRLIESKEITDTKEIEQLRYLIMVKKWNPYCIRHSAITADSDYLPEYALKKKVSWSINTKQGSRYIKSRMGNELKTKILEYNGITTSDSISKSPSAVTCPRCDLVNAYEYKFCSKCSYPLKPEAFDELKHAEEDRIKSLEERYIQDMENLKNELEIKFQLFLDKVDMQKIV